MASMGGSTTVRSEPDTTLPAERRRANRLGRILMELHERAGWMPDATRALAERFIRSRRLRIALAGPDFAELTSLDLERAGAFGAQMQRQAIRGGFTARMRPTGLLRPVSGGPR